MNIHSILSSLELLSKKIIHSLAQKATDNNRISVSKMDLNQSVHYDLAWGTALLFLSREAEQYSSKIHGNKHHENTVEHQLAKSFITDTLIQWQSLFIPHLDYIAISSEEYIATCFSQEIISFIQEHRKSEYISMLAVKINEQQYGQRGLNQEEIMISETFSSFAQDKVKPLAEQIHRKDLDIPDSILDGLKDLGCFGISISEEYGGFQQKDTHNNMHMIIVTEELSKASVGAAGSLITRPEIVAKAISTGGTIAQKQKWLTQFATGEKLPAVAVTEPDYGSDVASIQVSASPTDSGWIINGTKTWCTFAGKANVLMVLARTNTDQSLGHKGLSILLVEKPSSPGHFFKYTQESGGTMIGNSISTLGYRGMHSFEVSFENIFVPSENLIGEESGLNKGFYLQMAGFAGGRIQTAARAIGVMQAAMEEAIAYGKERKLFKKELNQYGINQLKLVKMASLVQIIRQATYATANLMNKGDGNIEASLIKFYSCKMAEWVTREALQIHGGMGYAEEYPVSRYFVDARVFTIFEGAEEVLALRVIAKSLLQKTIKTK